MDAIRFRTVGPHLAGMMFLQYFGLGAWVVSLSRYLGTPLAAGGLGFSPSDVGWVYTALPIGAILAPLFVGPLADRYFAAEKLLGVMQFIMAALLAGAGWWCERAAAQVPGTSQTTFFVLMVAYGVVCQPTLTLTNVIALRKLPKPTTQFSKVRLIGTFGWIVAGYAVAWGMNPMSPMPLYLAAATALVQGFASFTLPHTPPRGKERSTAEIIGLPAIRMFRDRAFVGFAIAAVIGNMMNQFYVLYATRYLAEHGTTAPEAVLTLGQWCEIACMAISPWLVVRFGLKPVMLAGLLGWVLRMAVLTWGSPSWAVAIALPMHGFSYAFFGMLAALFVDREAPTELRAGAQSLVGFLSSGPSVLIGNWLAGRVGQAATTANGTDWATIWLVPCVGCAIGALVFLLMFHEPPERQKLT